MDSCFDKEFGSRFGIHKGIRRHRRIPVLRRSTEKKRLIEHIGSLKTGGYWVIDTADSQDNEVRKDGVSDENVLG